MSAYLNLESFKSLSVMPTEGLDRIEVITPGWVDAQLEYWSAQIDARLAKRYATPFASPYPIAVLGWLSRIVTIRCYLKRGVDPNDLQFAEIKADADAAWTEIKEAADSNTGLFDLPLRADTTTSGIAKGGTYSYTEASPYVWTDAQGDQGRSEDTNRGGTYG